MRESSKAFNTIINKKLLINPRENSEKFEYNYIFKGHSNNLKDSIYINANG